MEAKIQELLAQLNYGLVDRDAVLRSALLSILAGENLLLVGPPGTGKSLIARRVSKCLSKDQGEQDYFEYLLTKFSTPEEIFGPLSISELKQDRFKRNTHAYLPEARVGFLDEIFKASSSILNSLLTILNERIYHNGAEKQKVPLRSLIGASNELPNDNDELGALYDRFLIRIFVDYVSPAKRAELFKCINQDEIASDALLKFDSDELLKLDNKVKAVVVPERIIKVVQQIWSEHAKEFKDDRRESLSDRRLVKVVNLMRVSAATNGREEVDLSDVFLLKDCLWNHEDNRAKVLDVIKKSLHDNDELIPVAGKDKTILAKNKQADVGMNNAAPGSSLLGWQGSGTKSDPFLVKNLNDLADMEREEVGQQGYYFKQMQDLDLSKLKSWSDISFKGKYDGNGFSIKSTKSSDAKSVFNVCSGCEFENIDLRSIILSKEFNDSELVDSESDCGFFKKMNNSIVNYCKSENFIAEDEIVDSQVYRSSSGYNASKLIDNSTISEVEVGGVLALDEAKNTRILNCVINLMHSYPSIDNTRSALMHSYPSIDNTRSAFSEGLDSCVIKSCLVLGDAGPRPVGLSGVGGVGIGFLNINTMKSTCFDGVFFGASRQNVSIFNTSSDDDCEINNVFVLDDEVISPQNNDLFSYVSRQVLDQRFFANRLGFDFDKVWDWDSDTNLPKLKDAQAAEPYEKSKTEDGLNYVSVLGKQLQANIWLKGSAT